MSDLKKKKLLAYFASVAALANIYNCLVFDPGGKNADLVKGVAAMIAVMLIVLAIEKWARFNKAYIEHKIAESKERSGV